MYTYSPIYYTKADIEFIIHCSVVRHPDVNRSYKIVYLIYNILLLSGPQSNDIRTQTHFIGNRSTCFIRSISDLGVILNVFSYRVSNAITIYYYVLLYQTQSDCVFVFIYRLYSMSCRKII